MKRPPVRQRSSKPLACNRSIHILYVHLIVNSKRSFQQMGLCASSSSPTGVGIYTPTHSEVGPEGMEKSKSASSLNKSSIKSVKGNKGSDKAEFRRSLTESKIQQALIKKKMEIAISDKPLTFEKILLKFDKLRIITGYIKNVFNEVAVDDHLDHHGLETLMKRLGVNMALDEMLDLFDFINVQEQKTISIKEFLVALTVGMVLDAIPALVHPSVVQEDSAALQRSISAFLGHQYEVKEMLNLIVTAYLLFDTQGKGYIERSGIEKTLDENGHHGHLHPVLSKERWAEMDWDANGTIDFAEFVFSFTSWIDVDED